MGITTIYYDTEKFVSNNDIVIIMDWLNDNEILFYRPFLIEDNIMVVSGHEYMAAKLRWA